ncbi:hypothetical protein AM504_19325 [Klebsiella michiganensis]|nr:hypothetical protein ABE97_13490 [Klebsiella michiganensis]KLU51007.1 hypothetical protein ABE84_05605 [Klebsiella michiganensis]VAC44152.1 Uncharacterised protein [Enterobacter hormaechei]
MPSVTVAKKVLNQTGTRAPLCQSETTSVPEHLRIYFYGHAGLFAGLTHNAIGLLAGQSVAAPG